MASIAIELNSSPDEIQQQSTDLPTSDVQLQLNTTSQEETNNRFGPSTTAAIATQSPPSNPIEIMKSLMKASAKERRDWMLCTFLVAILLIASSIGFFVWYNHSAVQNEPETAPVILGIFFVIPGAMIFVVSWICCCVYACCPHDQYDELNRNVEKTILLEGETWQHQVDAFQSGNLPNKRFVGCFARTKKLRRLKMRQYGHIVLAKEGIIVDELVTIMYEKYILLGVDCLMYNETQRECIIRLHLTARYYYVRKGADRTPVKFHIDIFMPPELELINVEFIGRNILFNSKKCLSALGFGR